MARSMLGAGAIILMLLFTFGMSAKADENYDPYGTWNQKKVYLSPARHSDAGSRGECGTNNENNMAYNTAWHATNGWHYQDVYDNTSANRNLRGRGYKVQIGTTTYQDAVTNSNNWGATVHIPIHSNAAPSLPCSSTTASRFGTIVMYKDNSTAGSAFATELKNALGPKSPGTNDRTCKNSDTSCTTVYPLAELQTNAVSGYVESEFHSWTTGVNWINNYTWPWRIGMAVDTYLGYPR